MTTDSSCLCLFFFAVTEVPRSRVFYKQDEIGHNAYIGIRGFATWKQKKSSNKMLPPVNIEPWPLINLWFQVPTLYFLS